MVNQILGQKICELSAERPSALPIKCVPSKEHGPGTIAPSFATHDSGIKEQEQGAGSTERGSRTVGC